MAAEGQLSPAEPDPKEANAPTKDEKTLIDIGAQYGRWVELKEDLQCGNDTLAKLLLDIWFEFKDEESESKPGRSGHKRIGYKKHPTSLSGPGCPNSHTPQSMNSSHQDSQDTLDSSTCSNYGDVNGSLVENTQNRRGTSSSKEHSKGDNGKSSRRKQPKSQVSRYLEDDEDDNEDDDELTAQERTEIAEATLKDYEAGRLKLEQEESGALESQDSFEDGVGDGNESNVSVKEEEEVEEEEEEAEDENDFLSEEELEKILKGSESESETKKSKRKQDSDSDWMPAADDEKPKRRRSRRLSSRTSARIGAGRSRRSSRRRVSTSADDSTEIEGEEEEAVVEEKPVVTKRGRGRPRKNRKDSVDEEDSKQNQRSQKPKLLKKLGTFTCTVCSNTFTSKEEGKEHLETHYTIDCNMCTQKFYSLQTLAHHQSKKHPANHKCNHCFFTGRTRMELKRHMRKDHQEAQAVPGTTLCHICGQQFRFVVNVQKHLMDVHGIMESNMKTYMCDQCGNEYFLKHSLRKHMLTHKDKNILCEFEGCGSKFSSDAQYKRHYNTVHLKIKRHSCPYDDCDMKFAFRKTLATHVNMVHLKLRLFPCTWQGCERSFYAKKHLTVHLRIHNDEKPFKCPECDYRCRQRAALNWHLKKHGIVPEHPESLENEKKNKKEGFPVNFKRGRKRTRFRKAKSLDYTDEQIASINQRYHEMVSGTDKSLYPVKDFSSVEADESTACVKEGSSAGSDQASFDGKDSVGRRGAGVVEDLKYLERREQATRPNELTQGYVRRDLQSPAQETFATELLKREVEYPRMDYEAAKQSLRVEDFSAVRNSEFPNTQDTDYRSVRDNDYQTSRENSLPDVRDGGYPSVGVRDAGFASSPISRENNFPQVREGDYHPVRDATEYHGFPMKENLDTDRVGFPRFLSKDVFSSSSHRETHFSPRLPMKDSYVTGHPVSEVDYSRFAPKNELAALRTLPPGYQSQMDVPPEYDPRSPVHAVMGGNPAGYSQDLQMYSREYK